MSAIKQIKDSICPQDQTVNCNIISTIYEKFLELIEHREFGSVGNSAKAFDIVMSICSTRLVQTQKARNDLALATLFRDIGKLCIDEEILNSPDTFDSDDPRWKKIKNHPQKSTEILGAAASFFSPEVMQIIKCHHPWYYFNEGFLFSNNWDEITVSYQIVSIIDSYLALRSQRMRRKEKIFNHNEAMKELMKDKRKFSPSLLKYLESFLHDS